MAQVKLLKINGDGTPVEFASASDDITLNSFTIQGGGPVLSSSGLNLNSQPISGLTNITVVAPSTDTINQTAGNLIIDNIMAKERSNLLSTAGELLFPVITDTAGTVDNLRLPQLAGIPTSTPTNTGSGFAIWDSSDKKLFIYDGSNWVDQSVAQDALQLQDSYIAGASALSSNDVLYLSASNTVSAAKADAAATSYAFGFAKAAALAAAAVTVVKGGSISGFSGLTPGSRYFVSPTTAGQITATLPVGSGNSIVMVGYARSATQLDIQFQNLGRRA